MGNINNNGTKNGVAAIPAIFALVVLMVAVVAGISSVSISTLYSSAGRQQSRKALAYAETGARDALMRISRDKTYACAAPADGCYQISFVENGCSDVSGCVKITVSAATAPKVVVATGQAGNYIRTLQVEVTFDASTDGEISDTLWREVVD